MANNNPVVTSWHGYKTGTSTAEVVLLGYGFGSVRGSVKLNVQGGGVVNAPILYWSDTAIVVSAPVGATIQRAHVYTLDSRGKEKQSAQSPAGEVRNTRDAAAPFAVTATDDNVDHIAVEGTDLSLVKNVVLYDSAAPSRPIEASFLMNDDTLEVDWPSSFVAPIKKMRLSDANGGHVIEVSGGVSGWTPDPNGIIIAATPQLIGSSAVINLLGSGFGAAQGTVKLAKVGQPLAPAPVLYGGWSDSVVQVTATPGTSYDQIVLTRADGEVATLDAGVVFPVVVPGGTPIITNVRFVGGKILVDGTGLMQLGSSLDMFVTSDELPGRHVLQLDMADYYVGTSYEFCGNMESKTDTLVTFKLMEEMLPQQFLNSRPWLNDTAPEFKIEDVHAHVVGVYSGPYEVNYVAPVPVAVSWTPIDQTNYPKVTSATHAGTVITLHGTNFDDIPRSQAAGVIFYDQVNGVIANLELFTGNGRLVSITNTEMQWEMRDWSTSDGNGLLDVLSRIDLFTTECDFTEHVLAAPMTYQ